MTSVLQCFSSFFENFFAANNNSKLRHDVFKAPIKKTESFLEIPLKFFNNLTN